MNKRFVILSAAILLASACAKNMDARTYRSDAPVGKVQRGTVLAVESVIIEDASQASENTVGALSGGALGGVGASTIGSGTGQSLATVSGVIAGAVAGAMIENELATQPGYQYIVQLDGPKAINPASDINHTRKDGESIEDDVKESIRLANTQSDIISVIQTDDMPLSVGDPVLVIYHEDRARLIADSKPVATTYPNK